MNKTKKKLETKENGRKEWEKEKKDKKKQYLWNKIEGLQKKEEGVRCLEDIK